jgi:hypothetical protein
MFLLPHLWIGLFAPGTGQGIAPRLLSGEMKIFVISFSFKRGTSHIRRFAQRADRGDGGCVSLLSQERRRSTYFPVSLLKRQAVA